MVVFPNAKINIGLHVTRKRADGYHDIETIFYPLYKYRDVLEVVRHNKLTSAGESSIHFAATGFPIDGSEDNNLCIRAYQILLADFPELPSVDMHLHKAIPMGAGMGGGSSDAAFALSLLNKKFKLGLSTEALAKYALQLGSDCPFFLYNRAMIATGRGEVLEDISIDVINKKIVVVSPNIHINTGWAFGQLSPSTPRRSLREIVSHPIESWKNSLENDFEKAVFPSYPQIEKIKLDLYAAGAIYASMTGSGSSVYGIFTDVPALPEFPPDYGLMIL